ncbi:MAG TPA: hypothetical protein VKZ89_14825 [Thermobifida alba]|nr:hypothetical protein [Thermobifida alba]
MDARTRISAIARVIGAALLVADAYLAACLDTRPLIRRAEGGARWLGRTWRRAAADARIRRHGPGRGVIAVTINRPTRPTCTDDKEIDTDGH